MKKTPRTPVAQKEDTSFTLLVPVGAAPAPPPPEPDTGRLVRGRVQKGRLARSDGFESRKRDPPPDAPVFDVKSAVPLDDDLPMMSVMSQGAASRVLLPPDAIAELPALPDPPAFYSEEDDGRSKRTESKSTMAKRLTSLKASLRNLPLFPRKGTDEAPESPKSRGKLHAGPAAAKTTRPPEDTNMSLTTLTPLGIDSTARQASRELASPTRPISKESSWKDVPSPPSSSRMVVRAPSKDPKGPSKEVPSPSSSMLPPTVPPSPPSPPLSSRIREKDAPGSPMSLGPPSTSRVVRVPSKDKPMSPSSPSKSSTTPAPKDAPSSPVRRVSQLFVRGLMQGKKDDAEPLRKDEDWEQAERLIHYQEELQTALELQARGQAIELKPMTAAEEKEQMELERQIEENGLVGKDALAFMLSAKLGSLEDAFQYMDTANRGQAFAFVSWHTGLLVLRIDPMKVAGLSVKQSFQSISCGKSEISKDAWDDYFANFDDTAFTGRRKRRVALKPKLPQVRVAEKPPEPPPPPPPPPPEPAPEKKPALDNKLKKATMKLAMLSRLKPEEEEEDEESIRAQAAEELSNLHPDESVKLLNLSRKKRAIHLQVARDLCLWSSTQGSSLLVMREGPIAQKLRQDVVQLSLCRGIRLRSAKAGPGMVLLGRTLAEAESLRISKATGTCPNACEELVLPKFSMAARSLSDAAEDDGYDVDIFNDRGPDAEIEAVLRQQLEELELKAMFEYPAAVGKDFRECAVRVSKEFGYDVIGVSGFQERVVVGNLKESVEQLHAELADVDEPGFIQFSSEISRLEKEVIRREARLKGYIVVEDESGLKVSRMTEAPTVLTEERKMKELCMLSAEVFAKYATGRAGAHIYMRRGDLLEMLKDAPSDRAEALAKPLYQAFDDTLHLQIELTKASNGLSKQFFKVFLDKAMQQAGWYPSPELLEALHKREEEGDEEEYEDVPSD